MIAQLRSAVLVALIVGTASFVHASDDVWEALRAHGSVVSDVVGLNVGMGAFVVLRRAADGTHAVAGRLFVDD